MSRPLNSYLEALALRLPRVGFIDQACDVIAEVYRGEIESLPFGRTSIGRLFPNATERDFAVLVRLTVRDLQRWAATIIAEQGLADADAMHDALMTFAPAHAEIVRRAWDAEPTAPVWKALTRSVGLVFKLPCDACKPGGTGTCVRPNACNTAIAAMREAQS